MRGTRTPRLSPLNPLSPRRPRRIPGALLGIFLAALAAACGGAGAGAGEAKDPLAAEIARSSALLMSKTGTGEIWEQVRQGAAPVLARAEEDLRAGRRLIALQRLAAVRVDLAAVEYMSARPAAQRKDTAGFEAEWKRMGGVLRQDLGAPSPGAFDGVEPAAVRALGEAALPQVRVYYDASLEYGRSTMPDSGLYYLGTAQAQREVAAFLRTMSAPTDRRAPPLRSLDAELDALEAEMLAAYRPPASIDRHGEFINASATLKEARELNAAGLHYGALLRYLQAAQRLAPLRASPPALAAGLLDERLRELEGRLAAAAVDHSIGQMFLESAESALAPPAVSKDPSGPAPATATSAGAPQARAANPALASAIAADVLPRYFAALAPARSVRPTSPKAASQVAITLVRWPYT